MRTDTCSIVAISLNIQEKVHPIIWSLSALPFDCLQCMPVSKPIGEFLIPNRYESFLRSIRRPPWPSG